MSIQISKMLKILKKIKIDHFRAKTRKKIFKKIYFFCKMLIFQDFSKFLKILKSTVQYLCRDISNVKIGLYLRSSHKKDWKTHFGPTALKNQKIEKRKQWSIIIFLYLSGNKNRKSDHRSYAFGPPSVYLLSQLTRLSKYVHCRSKC